MSHVKTIQVNPMIIPGYDWYDNDVNEMQNILIILKQVHYWMFQSPY